MFCEGVFHFLAGGESFAGDGQARPMLRSGGDSAGHIEPLPPNCSVSR